MSNILKLTVKKEVFDNLANGKQDYVYVESNSYWIRRLALNSSDSFNKLKETQAFRTFDEISVTCLKENATYPFGVISTGHQDMSVESDDTGFVIYTKSKTPGMKVDIVYDCYGYNDTYADVTLNLNAKVASVEVFDSSNDGDSEIEDKNEMELEEKHSKVLERIKSEMKDADGNSYFDEEYMDVWFRNGGKPKNGITADEKEELQKELAEKILIASNAIAEKGRKANYIETNMNIKESIDFIIDVIGTYDNVVVVGRPLVIITSNGRIIGSKQRLKINNEEEIKVQMGIEKIYDDTNNDAEFLKKIENYLMDYVKIGHTFIWKDGCALVNTPNGRYFKMRMTKKLYLNR